MDPEIFNKVKKLTAEEFGVPEDELFPTTDFYEDLDESLQFTQLVMACEEDFAIDIPDEDAIGLNTIAKLSAYISRRLDKLPPDGAPEVTIDYSRTAKSRRGY